MSFPYISIWKTKSAFHIWIFAITLMMMTKRFQAQACTQRKRSQTISVYVLRTSIIVANDFKQKAETQSFPKSGETIKHDLLNVKINK